MIPQNERAGRRRPAWLEAEACLYLFRHICSVSSPKRGFDSTKWRASVYSGGNRKPASKFASKICQRMGEHVRSRILFGTTTWPIFLERFFSAMCRYLGS
jgi:hypothetical protein